MRIPPYLARPTPPGRVLTAAAQRIDLASDDARAMNKKRVKTWQNDAWHYYDTLGEVWFAHRFVAHLVRRIMLNISIVNPIDPTEAPMAVESPDAGTPAAVAMQALNRLRNGSGGHGDMLESFSLNLGVAGDSNLVGFTDPAINEEVWRVYSTDQLVVNPSGDWVLKQDPEDREGTVLQNGSAFVSRIWRPHPRWRNSADSSMRAVLDECDELSILSKMIRSTGRSRLSAGMLLVPNDANVKSINPNGNRNGRTPDVSPLLADLIETMITPIQDEGTAAAIVPLLMEMKGDLIEKVRHLSFDRPLDPEMSNQRNELISRIAMGLDIPAEILLGLADVNHWTAWQLDEQTFKAHIEPLVLLICNGITVSYLWPTMIQANIPIEVARTFVVNYDAAAVIGHPSRAQDAKDAHDSDVISDQALRTYLGFTDADAPTPEELADRRAARAAERPQFGQGQPGLAGPGGRTAPAAPGPPATVVTAAGRKRRLAAETVTSRLSRIESSLRTRLLTSADRSAKLAIRQTGARLRVVRDVAATTPDALVAAGLGPTATFETLTEDEILAAALLPLRAAWDQYVTRAQQELVDLATEGQPVSPTIQERMAEDREAGWAVLAAGMGAFLLDRLFTPAATPPAMGEFDDLFDVPVDVMRAALSRAGGTLGSTTAGGSILSTNGTLTTGLTTGDTARDWLASLGYIDRGYRWQVGAPARPFHPHQALSGYEFSRLDDPLLASGGAWPFVGHYYPGDHRGCQCDLEMLLEEI